LRIFHARNVFWLNIWFIIIIGKANLGTIFHQNKFIILKFSEMSSILKRIKIISEKEGISVSALEASIGASKGVFTRALANDTDIQAKWLVNVAEKYPDYSSEWLLRGEGEMLKPALAKEDGETYLTPELEGIANGEINTLKQLIASQSMTIKSQEKTIMSLERLLSSFEREIESLRNK